MFIFLTTCYMYHPSQKGDFGQADIDSLQGTLQNVPVQISMPNSSGRGSTLLYEATLTLKPCPVAGSNRMGSKPSDGDSKTGRHSLDNMRRSPYFSESFLQPPQSKADYARFQIEEPDEEGRFEVLSREEASRDVEKLLSLVQSFPSAAIKPQLTSNRSGSYPPLQAHHHHDLPHAALLLPYHELQLHELHNHHERLNRHLHHHHQVITRILRTKKKILIIFMFLTPKKMVSRQHVLQYHH